MFHAKQLALLKSSLQHSSLLQLQSVYIDQISCKNFWILYKSLVFIILALEQHNEAGIFMAFVKTVALVKTD